MTEAIVPRSSLALRTVELGGREKAVVDELGRFGDARVAFQGLRRRLGLHPQALTRTLRSLERAGIIAHDARGYFVTPQHRGNHEIPGGHAYQPVFAGLLPSHVEPQRLADQLSRRWFQGLRWYGITQDGNEFLLHWILESDNSSVRLRVTPRAIGLELESHADGLPFEAAAPILHAIATYYGRRSLPGSSQPKLPATAG